jgi:hypothetical protein
MWRSPSTPDTFHRWSATCGGHPQCEHRQIPREAIGAISLAIPSEVTDVSAFNPQAFLYDQPQIKAAEKQSLRAAPDAKKKSPEGGHRASLNRTLRAGAHMFERINQMGILASVFNRASEPAPLRRMGSHNEIWVGVIFLPSGLGFKCGQFAYYSSETGPHQPGK